MNATHDIDKGLALLAARLQQDLSWLNLPPAEWVPPMHIDGRDVLDVAVIGGGMLGLVALAALQQAGIFNIRAFDRAEEGQEGPWITYARMETLRTKKEAAGPALGIPSLTFRAWFETQHGPEAWAQMDLIPRAQWMDYLRWYRQVLNLPVTNRANVTAVIPRDDGLIEITIENAGKILARRAIIATGIDGLGAPNLPAVANGVSRRFIAHGADLIDMTALVGKRVAVVGAGSSAMDNAAAALEAGAASVDIFVRRAAIPAIDRFSGTGSIGMTHGYVGLPDALKWQFMVEGERSQIPPPRHSVQRVARHSNAHFHVSSPVLSLEEHSDDVTLVTPKGRYPVDFIIFATGFSIDLDQRPEFSALEGRYLNWGDAYQGASENAALAAMPYLGPAFEFIPREAGDSVAHIHCFAFPATMSHGKITSGIPAISHGATRLVRGIASSLFAEDAETHLARFRSYDTPEIHNGDWHDADQKAAHND